MFEFIWLQHSPPRIRKNENHDEKIKDAIGDVLIFLMDYCTREGLDIQSILQKTWNDVKSRDWKKDPSTAHLKGKNWWKNVNHAVYHYL